MITRLRGLRKWRPPRFTDDITPLLRIFDPQAVLPTRSTKKGEEEITDSAVEATEGDVQGNVQIKMVVSNGKRASDRSWKQVWGVLHGTKLYLYRHHPSQGYIKHDVMEVSVEGSICTALALATINDVEFSQSIPFCWPRV
uniref:PH domain-containing protein n=1 Tax=Heliothis virescens TaxID=7102 RepID=A0A2A4IZD9_HELVI